MTKRKKPMPTATIESVADDIATEQVVSVVVSNPPRARSRTFVAKPCTECEALRERDTNFTRVFATRGNIRYCRCHFCGNIWKDSGDVPQSGK